MEETCAVMIPIVAIGGGLAVVILGMYFKYQTRQRFFEERAKLIEAMRETGNVELEKLEALHSPGLEENYLDDYSRGDRKANLKAGIILITIAIALWLFMRFFVIEHIGGSAGLQLVGLFPGLLGLAFLFIHYTCQPKDENNNNKQ
jgi:hypothetical protein